MRRYHLINFASILSIIVSIGAWYFLLPNYLEARKGEYFLDKDENVEVEGVQTFSSQEGRRDQGQTLTFGQLMSYSPEAPKKKEGFGDTYMRAASAIAIDAETGTILHYQNGKKRMPIASLTKMMTAIVVVESIKSLDDEIVTIGETPRYIIGTRVGCPRTGYCNSDRLQYGEKISARSLLEAMLMGSANDAAVALAEHIAGTEEKFADLMNDKAKEIGLDDTNFCNASGLDVEGKEAECFSSAYDFARITSYSLRHDLIWDIMRIKEKEVCSVDGKITHLIVNTDILLDQLPNCIGGKTGFTYGAGKSLMMAAHHPANKRAQVVAVLLDDNHRWEDMGKLFDWVFVAYSWPFPEFN